MKAPLPAVITAGKSIYESIRDGRGADRVRDLLEARTWTFAKSMADNPHWYTVRDQWPAEPEFYACVYFIRLHGFPDWWPTVEYGKAYVAFRVGEYHYWTMGDKLSYTWLINRKPIDPTKCVPPPVVLPGRPFK